jgi:hypothetical protein
LRIGDLQADGAAHLDQAVQHDVLAAHEDVFQVRLVQPHRAQRPAPVVDRRFEDLEAGPPRRAQAADQHAARDGGGLSRRQRRDRLKTAAVFVAQRESIEEIFESDEAGMLKIGGAAGTDALEKLQGRRKGV